MNCTTVIKRYSLSLAALFIALFLLLSAGCSQGTREEADQGSESTAAIRTSVPEETESVPTDTEEQTESAETQIPEPALGDPLDSDSVPVYTGEPFCIINNNDPEFSEPQLTTVSYEYYSELDGLGRCGVCVACVGKDLMPTEERGSIGQIKPTGWQTVKYESVDGNYLYNRCHLIAYQIAGENENTKNLITGTRYMNKDGMLPFENMVTDYVKETGNHVLYRSTPVFAGDELLARGVHLEAYSVEDGGAGIRFNVFCYNVQPGITIDYSNCDSRLTDGTAAQTEGSASVIEPAVTPSQDEQTDRSAQEVPATCTYVLNKNTKKFHYPYCDSVDQMADKNKLYFDGTRDEAVEMGYVPCKNCNP